MGSLTPPTHAVHEINGMKIFHDEPYLFHDQAHALALMTEHAIRDVPGEGRPNDELVASALRGIASLIELASIGMKAMDAKAGRRGG